jgi:hypothetical protein
VVTTLLSSVSCDAPAGVYVCGRTIAKSAARKSHLLFSRLGLWCFSCVRNDLHLCAEAVLHVYFVPANCAQSSPAQCTSAPQRSLLTSFPPPILSVTEGTFTRPQMCSPQAYSQDKTQSKCVRLCPFVVHADGCCCSTMLCVVFMWHMVNTPRSCCERCGHGCAPLSTHVACGDYEVVLVVLRSSCFHSYT